MVDDADDDLVTVNRVLDAHLHVVDRQTSVDDLTGNPNARWWERLDCAPEAVADRVTAACVSGGVLVQAVGAHGFDNSLVLRAAEALGDDWRAMVAVGSTVKDPLSLLEGAVALRASGLRLFSIPDPWLGSDAAVELVQRCADSGVGPSVCCFAEELPAIARIAAAVPDCEIALEHCGFVSLGGDDRALVDLATCENLVVKLSTGVFDAAALSPRSAVGRLVDLFGAERIVWGSDHPQVQDRGYPELVTLVGEALSGLDAATRAAVLGGTTARLWFDP